MKRPTMAVDAGQDAPVKGRDAIPRRWTLHGLNNGMIFGATYRGVAALPPAVSYAIGHAGTWLAWRLMGETRAAIADNLSAIFPDESTRLLERRARDMMGAYARDVIDFLRALDASETERQGLFDYRSDDAGLFVDLLAKGRGIILVSGHYGNWEAGGLFLRRIVDLPLTILVRTESNPDVNRLRREIRDRLGVDTIEVRKSLDTALQIRRRLADNHVVAMLMDRHLGRDRIKVQFLGRQAWFLKTAPLMGFMTGAPLVPCFIERIARGRFQVRSGTPITVARDRPREQAIALAAQDFADQLSARVRAHPEFWYHFYRYWDAQRD
jgi:lauroyl/myristoyl acyltransferase